MKYDFTSVMDRTGRDAIAVDVIPFAGERAGGFFKTSDVGGGYELPDGSDDHGSDC